MADSMSKEFIQRLEDRLELLGKPLLFFGETDSSNQRLKELALSGATHGTCVWADYQTKGRGRLGRQWQAAAGKSLLFSLLLKQDIDPRNMFVFTALAGLAICQVLKAYGIDAQIKWPNDIFVNGLKLCGMLSEIVKDGLIIGIGVNVNQDEAEMSDLSGVSLKMLDGKNWSREDLLVNVLNQFSSGYLKWQQSPYAWHSDYIGSSWLIGKTVVVQDGVNRQDGEVETIGMDGHLLLRGKDGDRLKVSYGDVSLLAIDGKYK